MSMEHVALILISVLLVLHQLSLQTQSKFNKLTNESLRAIAEHLWGHSIDKPSAPTAPTNPSSESDNNY